MAITQPRRVAAIAMAGRVSDEMGSRLGDEVGYTIRFEDQSNNSTKIKYMTDGILVRECLYDPDLLKYSVIMLDEAHERSLNTDILFGLVKNICKRRSDIKILITSATLDEVKFSTFFDNAPVIRVPGRVFPVDIFHSKLRQVMTTAGPANSSYVNDAVNLAIQIHHNEEPGHILIFLTGQNEIDRACDMIRHGLLDTHSNDADSDEMMIIPLYGALSGSAQQNIFRKFISRKSNRSMRKCIVATNIAETSITVPFVRYVIDSGYVKQKTFDPSRHMESLIVVPISQVSSQQRAGRAGRTGPGKCYRLYSSDCYQNMMTETVPEILRTNLANTILYLKVLGINDILGFDFLDTPSELQTLEALIQLHQLGALDDQGNASALGKQMSDFPLEPTLSRCIVAALEYNCLNEMITVAAMISVESVWIEASKQQKKNNSTSGRYQSYLEAIEEAHSKLRHAAGDHISYLSIFALFDSVGHRSKEWCEDNFINYRSMSTAARIRDQIFRDISKYRAYSHISSQQAIRLPISEESIKFVTKCLLHGYYMNAARCCSGTSNSIAAMKGGSSAIMYRTLPLKRDEEVLMVYMHPSSALAFQNPPHYLIYQELTTVAGKTYIRNCSKVNESTLVRYTSQWKEPSSSLILTGRKAPLVEESSSDVTNVSDMHNNQVVLEKAAEESVQLKRKLDESVVDEAKLRYLARKKVKS
jgi:ATP-dependent RNA helicase DHX8/PRP22